MRSVARRFARGLYRLGRLIADSARAEHMRQIKARFACCGPDVLIRADVTIHGPEYLSAGRNISIGDGCRIMAIGGLTIGDNVIISRDVTIYCSDHAWGRGNALPFGDERIHRPVTICDNVWIGAHVRILPGTTIGEGAIVGMGAIVAGEVPPLAIVGQQKFRILGQRDKNDYEKAVAACNFHRGGGVQS